MAQGTSDCDSIDGDIDHRLGPGLRVLLFCIRHGVFTFDKSDTLSPFQYRTNHSRFPVKNHARLIIGLGKVSCDGRGHYYVTVVHSNKITLKSGVNER